MVRIPITLAAIAGIAALALADPGEVVADLPAAQHVTVVGAEKFAAADPAPKAEARGSDPLAGIYTRAPFISQCANKPVVGPLARPEPGSLEAQPLYHWMLDFQLIGACVKPL